MSSICSLFHLEVKPIYGQKLFRNESPMLDLNSDRILKLCHFIGFLFQEFKIEIAS